MLRKSFLNKGKLSEQRGTIIDRRLTLTRSGKMTPFYVVEVKNREGGKV
jgi:hypothetical protein